MALNLVCQEIHITSLRGSIDKVRLVLANAVMSLGSITSDRFAPNSEKDFDDGIQDVIVATKIVKVLSEALFYLEAVSSGCREYQLELQAGKIEDFESIDDIF